MATWFSSRMVILASEAKTRQKDDFTDHSTKNLWANRFLGKLTGSTAGGGLARGIVAGCPSVFRASWWAVGRAPTPAPALRRRLAGRVHEGYRGPVAVRAKRRAKFGAIAKDRENE